MDLTTTYLGKALKNPVVASSSPLWEDLDNLRRMEDSGAAVVVLHSLFEEQIERESQELDERLSHGSESFAESLTYFPDMTSYNLGPEGYLEHLARAKSALAIPVIASLNGVTTGGWIEYAKKMEAAGADAIELNIYHLPTDPQVTGAQVERSYIELVQAVKSSVRIPVAVKLGPFFSSTANMARQLDDAKADALVLFNRFYQPDFDLEMLEATPRIVLSNSTELLLRLHWVGVLYGHLRADLAVTGGVHTAEDVLKAMMAGARVAMMTSALLQEGIRHLTTVLAELEDWMEEHEYASIREMQGSMSRGAVADPAVFDRANYMRVLSSYARCPPLKPNWIS